MGVSWFLGDGEELPTWERLCSLAMLAGVRVEEFEMFVSFDSSRTVAAGVFNRSSEGRRLAMEWLAQEYEALYASMTPEPTVFLLVEPQAMEEVYEVRSWWSRLLGWFRGR